jgi:hypothetical protein
VAVRVAVAVLVLPEELDADVEHAAVDVDPEVLHGFWSSRTG